MNSAPTSRLPIVCFGEEHTNPQHSRLLRKALPRLAKLGYGVLLLEQPQCLDRALQTFLQSDGGAEASTRFWAAHWKMRVESGFIVSERSKGFMERTRSLSPERRELEYANQGRQSFENPSAQRLLILAWAAQESGMRVFLIDGNPGEHYMPSAKDGKSEEGMLARNRVMAANIEKYAKEFPDKGVIVFGGSGHLGQKTEDGSSLGAQLKERDITNVLSLAGGIYGIRCRVQMADFLDQQIDRVVNKPRKLVKAVERRIALQLLSQPGEEMKRSAVYERSCCASPAVGVDSTRAAARRSG